MLPHAGPRGANAPPESRERRTENRTRDKRATDETIVQSGEVAVLVVLPRRLRALSKKATETQGMGTVVRRNAPNGEVPSPLRSLRVFVGNTGDDGRLTSLSPVESGRVLRETL